MARLLHIITILSLSIFAAAQGTQFITGPCKSDTDCASACCGFTSGKCAGPVVARERDGGCGFGNAQPNDDAARALTGEPASKAPTVSTSAASGQPVPSSSAAVAAGTQFITGTCASDADCASKCCAFGSGKCAAPAVAKESGGCGFGDAQPNNNALAAVQRRFIA